MYSNNSTELSKELFKNPDSAYRAFPFWGWNGALDKEELCRQIEIFKKMGMGGFHMHARAGLSTEYLGEEFMDCVKECCDKAKEEGMLAWLYDEDRYPSGPAGGIVTKNPCYTRRYLRFTSNKYNEEINRYKDSNGFAGRRKLIANYDVELDENGLLKDYKRTDGKEPLKGTAWYAYFECEEATTQENQAYVDTLNPRAVEEFVRVTYDLYHDKVGEYFGNICPAIFTDEPQYQTEIPLAFAAEPADVILPWTDDFAETFISAYKKDILEALPEVVWNKGDGYSQIRYWYHDHIAERFAKSYCDTLGNWCNDKGIMLTGHMMSEGSLEGQTIRSGEAMRSYRAFHIPGIDVLGLHKLEYTTAKQAQSAARQQSSAGLMSELYGVSGWDFDFRSFKLQGDWQAACGITVRVPHHSWYTMKGEGKRDYPGSISYQAPWWEEYHQIEDHFARINTALTRGKPLVRVGVIHPIESMWVNYGPKDQSGMVISQLEKNFNEIINVLIEGLIDFDFISEARLPDLCKEGGNPLKVGAMEYDVIIVPGLHTIRSTTLERITEFHNRGGRLLFMGDCPEYLDGAKSDEVKTLYESSRHFSFEGAQLMAGLADMRFVDAALPDGSRANHLVHTIRCDNDDTKWLFLATARSMPSPDADIPNQQIKFNVGQSFEPEVLKFTLSGEYILVEYNTQTGDTSVLPASYSKGKTMFSRRWHMQESLLLRLVPGKHEGKERIKPVHSNSIRFFDAVTVSLDEPNVMLFDMAEYSINNDDSYEFDEILRIDNIYRSKYNLPKRKRAVSQPYKIKDISETENKVSLRFRFDSEVTLDNAYLAMEDPAGSMITLNGVAVETNVAGYYADKAIEKVKLPKICEGENILEISCGISMLKGLEYCYILGDFGVSVTGIHKKITAPVRTLHFGSWVHQGLPFYGGNVTYHLEAECGGAVLRVPHYRGALLKVYVDGEDFGSIIYSPYEISLDGLKQGKHKIDIKAYGTRQNVFAPTHHLGSIPFYQGPDSWRSTGDLWNYEYSLSDKGIMSSPRIYCT